MKVVDSNDDKSWNPELTVKVAATNHLDVSRCWRQSPWQVGDKPICVTVMEFSPLQCMEKVGDKVRSQKSTKQIMKVGDVICIADFHDLSATFHAGKFRWKSQSRHNGIWARPSQETFLTCSKWHGTYFGRLFSMFYSSTTLVQISTASKFVSA